MIDIFSEDRDLYKGIFWVKDIDNIESTDLYFQIPCDMNGDVDTEAISTSYSSKNSRNYNHENVWKSLKSDMTDNKKFNYYPRGRVEIANGKAVIYSSPYISNDALKNWAIDKFNLTSHNGIKSVRLVADGSDHYKCYLDE